MEIDDDEATLRIRVDEFIRELQGALQTVAPLDECEFAVEARRDDVGPTLVIGQADPIGITLRVAGAELFRLRVSFNCTWSASGGGTQRYLTVVSSSYKVFVPQAPGAPLFTFDYLRHADEGVPVSHLNVHGHRDEVVFAMLNAVRAGRGKRRAKEIEKFGKVPRLADLHFPLGGPRFRPALEDLLEMLIVEFGIDPTKPDWRRQLERGRQRYRVTQLRAAASDDLEAVADLLEERGYSIIRPEPRPPRRVDRLSDY
jgi:hypothetical protein